MRLARRMELQHSGIQSMIPVSGLLPVFAFEYETNLTRLMCVLREPKSARHQRLGDADPVELTGPKLVSETVHAARGRHHVVLRQDCARRECQADAPSVLYGHHFFRQLSFMSWKPIVLIIRGLAAMIIGYGVIAVLTSWGFPQIHGGGSLYGGSPLPFFAGTILPVLFGLICGGGAGVFWAFKGGVYCA